jgi:hypothetical protein
MTSSATPHPSTAAPGNGASPDGPSDSRSGAKDRTTTHARSPRSPLLAKLTSLTSIATVTAAAMIVVGILAIVGGSYDKQVIHDQLTPQHISFPKPATNPGLAAVAGQQVLTGSPAKRFAQKQIGVDLTKVAAERTTLFTGETLNGLLLNAWGWSQIGSIATLAGIILIILGAILCLLPLANWQINLRGRHPITSAG